MTFSICPGKDADFALLAQGVVSVPVLLSKETRKDKDGENKEDDGPKHVGHAHALRKARKKYRK